MRLNTFSFALPILLTLPAASSAWAQTSPAGTPQGSGQIGTGAAVPASPPPPNTAPAAPVPPSNAAAAPAGSVAGAPPSAAADTSLAAPVSTDALPVSEKDEWTKRDQALNESNNLSGSAGLLYMQHAQGAAPGQLRIGFMVDYFSAGFLCSPQFPCRNVNKVGSSIDQPATVTSDTLDHIGGTLSLAVGVTKWLEAYAATRAYANSDNQGRPALLQVLGDSILGAKAYWPLSDIFHVGGFFDLWLVNGTGSVGLASEGTGFHLGGIFTTDMRPRGTPVRFGLQAHYTLDNTGAVVDSVEKERGRSITRIERFGLGISRVDHFDIGLGGEFFAMDEKIRPFLEYNFQVPTNRQNYLCHLTNESSDKCMANEAIVPSKLTLGGRFFPWKRGLGFTAAFDIGVTGTGNFAEEITPVAPWTLFLGAGWGADTQDRPSGKTKTVEKLIESKRPRIVGKVHEREKPEGIVGAIVTYSNHPDWSGHVTTAQGSFATGELDEGKYVFLVKAEGFKDSPCEADVPHEVAPGIKEIPVDCSLEALPKVGTVVGHVRDADSQQAVANATIKLKDAAGKELSLGSDNSGAFRAEQLSGGNATFTVEADGYMAFVQQQDLKVRQDNAVDLLVRKRPKDALVAVSKKEISIKQQIQFGVDSSQILPASFPLMGEIADAFVRNPWIKKVEVQGHTDNSGTADHNQSLSDQRAQAVADWLSAHGVSSDRIAAKGYGQTKPLVPNVTTANKARNRRVQFIILEQDAPPLAPAKGGPAKGLK